MSLRISVLFVAALLCAAVYLLLADLLARGWPGESVVLIACSVACTMSAAAATLGSMALYRATGTRADMARLARMVEEALRDVSSRTVSNAAALVEVEERLSRDLSALAARLRPHPEDLAATAIRTPSTAGNVIPLSGEQRPASADGAMRGSVSLVNGHLREAAVFERA